MRARSSGGDAALIWEPSYPSAAVSGQGSTAGDLPDP
jgi:hypothetical protein